jgi:hypothetical protein
MGLTIHYNLRAKTRSARKAMKLLERLRQRALDLPFAEVGEIVELEGEACDFQGYDRDNPLRWLAVQAGQYVIRGDRHYRVAPSHVIAFTTWPGEGCEGANFGLGIYPKTIEVEHWPHGTAKLRTGIKDWSWASFCKTQYASNPECGGVPHFLRCHLSVVKMLDFANELGILEAVKDEGGFWEQRNVEALAREVGEWNEMIAAQFGKLQESFGEGLVSPITEYPDFEHLEAKGREPKQSP